MQIKHQAKKLEGKWICRQMELHLRLSRLDAAM